MKTGKRILSILLSVIMALGVCAAAPVTAGAEFDEVDGIKWSYEILEGSTGVRIIPGSEPADAAVSISGNIAIPSVLHLDDRDYIVIEIGDGAFNDVMFSGVTGITIPDTVKKIGVRAFQNMTNLTSVSFGEGSALTTIGVNAFYGCKNLSSIDIPQGVTTIGNYAFQDCQNLESVVIPDNVTTLGTYAFRNCTNLQSAVIGANVPSLNGTFASCGNLESVTFSSNSVTDFSGYTFYGCSELTSITIPCNFDKAKFTSGSSYINVNDVGDTFTVQGTSASGTFSYTHNYGEPVWNWDDVSHPTYTAYCAGCGAEKTGGADRVTFTHTNPDGAVPGYTEAKASVTIDGETYESTHTVDAFEISDYAELKEFASRVNGGETGLIGVLTADIDASASAEANDWTPIGNDYGHRYTGTFDGLGHKITGLTFNNPQQDYAGLFGYVDEGGKVRNVGLEGGSITGQKHVGGVAGYNYGGIIENCYNTGSVSGEDAVGGLVGENAGVSMMSYYLPGQVINCRNTGPVSARGCAGGVAGTVTNGTVDNCYNTGDITSTGYYYYAYAGGIVGHFDLIIISQPYISVDVITDCYNTGKITATAAAIATSGNNYTAAHAYAGGIVSTGNSQIMYSGIKNCFNAGDVYATVKTEFAGWATGEIYVGGIIGDNPVDNLTGCCNTGDVTAESTGVVSESYAGGLAGSTVNYVDNCFNTGNVTVKGEFVHSLTYTGGLIGENVGTIQNCYNSGDVSVTAIKNNYEYYTDAYVRTGGVVGNNEYKVIDCYNAGNVTVTATGDVDRLTSYSGGVAGYNGKWEGYPEGSGVITNCYYDRDVAVITEAGESNNWNAVGVNNDGTVTDVTGLTTGQMTGESALDNMTGFTDENWLVKENETYCVYYPHLKGFNLDEEGRQISADEILFANWPPKNAEFPLWVGGNQVTSDNADSLDALDGIAVSDGGSVKFVPDADGKGGTLYLNNATITGTQSYKSGGTHDSNILVENKEFNITINLEGENTLGPAERGIWMVNNSASSGLALTGDGKLSIMAEENGILINCDLLIDGADINVTATGGDSGGTGIIADDIDIRNSSVYAEGTGDQYGIFCASALTISDSSVESGCTGTYGRGLYFSDEENFTVSGDSFVTLEGGTRYGALWIKGSLITENGNEIVEPANYIIDPLETGSDVYLVYDVSADEKIPAVNVIITNPLTITVTANPTGGGTITGGGKTYKGADVALTAAPETGYDFVSWTEGTSVVSTNAKYSFTVEQSRNLVANFKLQVKSVSVSANIPDGGTVSGAGTYNYGENATVTALSKDHYSFVNWTENGAEVSTNANYSFPVTGDRNLVANFAKDKHTVEFVNDDGAGLQSVQVPYGETPKYTGETPTKEATAEYTYTFAGWSPEISEVTGDATYTATYTETPIDYKLTWKVDGESYKNETIPFGGNITEPEVDERAGYTFAWVDEIPATMPAEDVTINGEFTVIEYTATFVDENGETVEKVKFTVEDESITEPDVPEKAGYTGEWEEYTLGTSDITIKPVYANLTSIQIENYEENSEIGYREDVTYTVDASDLPEGAEIHWFVNGEDVGTGESYTVEDPTDDYNIYAEVIDKDGNTLDTTKIQSVKVRNGFFDRLKAFFAELIEKILGKAIIDILTSIC